MHVGDLAPDFTLVYQHGVPRSLSGSLEDGPVVLFFYPAALSKGCTQESCHFRDLASEFAALGAQRIGISMDSLQRQARFAEQNNLDYPVLGDIGGNVARQFGVKRSLDFLKVKRTTFVIGRDQRILDVIASELNMNVHAERAIASLKAHSS